MWLLEEARVHLTPSFFEISDTVRKSCQRCVQIKRPFQLLWGQERPQHDKSTNPG